MTLSSVVFVVVVGRVGSGGGDRDSDTPYLMGTDRGGVGIDVRHRKIRRIGREVAELRS